MHVKGERKIYCTFVIKLLILFKFMKGCNKPITVTERMNAQTKRLRTQNLQSKETKTFVLKSFKKGKEKIISEKQRV